MGILDELEEKLRGDQLSATPGGTQGVVERVVDTPMPVPRIEGALDRLAKKMRQREGMEFFMDSDEAMTGKKAIKPEPGEEYKPEMSAGFVGRHFDPAKTPEAVGAARALEVRQGAMSSGQPTIGQPTEKQRLGGSIMPPWITEGVLAGRRAASTGDWAGLSGGDEGAIAKGVGGGVAGQVLDRTLSASMGGIHKLNSALLKAGQWFERVTGLPHSTFMERATSSAEFYRDYFAAKSGRIPGSTKQKDLSETTKIAADTVGSLLVDLPQIIALGPVGLAVHGGAYGLAEGGLEGMIAGTIQGSLVHGIFRGISGLPSLWQAPAAAMIGGATAAMEADDPRQILANAATWGILQGQGGHGNKTVKQFAAEMMDTQVARDIAGSYRAVRGERAVKRLRDSGISREEFILRFPEMKAHLRDMDVEGVIRSLDPDIELESIRDAGGALKVAEWLFGPMRHQHRLVTDMVRSRIGLPTEKVAGALQSIAEGLSDSSLIQQHYAAKLRIGESAAAMPHWQESILHGEILRRGLKPMVSGKEYVLEKYGPQGWDEITGHTDVERQAIDNVTAELNRHGILTGEAAARAESDTDPSPGAISPARLKAMYNSELKKLLGLNRLADAPQWADYFRGKYVPREAKLVDVRPEDRLTLAQLFLGTGRSRGYTTPAGYVMVPAPQGHPRANARGLLPWHQLLMESKLGRVLVEGEVVHHKNHRPEDNSPDNLELMDYADHIRHHKSAEGRAIDDALLAAELEKGPDKSYRIENYDTMELRQSTELEPVGPREFKLSVQKPRRGRPTTQFEEYGSDLKDWELRQASKGRVGLGPEGVPPEGATLPSGEFFVGLERFKAERNGDVTMIAHVKDADGNYYTRELTRLTPEEAARYRSGKGWGDLIDDIVSRVSQDRPAGGVQVKYLDQAEPVADGPGTGKIRSRITKLQAKLDELIGGSGWDRNQFKYVGGERAKIEDEIEALQQELKTGVRPAPKAENEPGWEIERVRAPFSTRGAGPDTEPGPGEILTKDGEVIKKGPGVTRRILDNIRWPAVEEPPAGVRDFDKDLLLHDDFRSREQPTVRDVFELHNEHGASTVNIYEGDMVGSDMWAVSLYPERSFVKKGKSLTKDEIYDFFRENADLLSSDPRLNIGTWYNRKNGKTYVDVTILLPKDQAALAEELGRKYNQISVTLLDSEFTFPSVETGGTGKPKRNAGWLPEAERANDLFQTGEMIDVYHFGSAPDITPQAMGRGAIGEEGRQFNKGYRGLDMLSPGYYLKSNFYTPETKNVEAHLWGGRGLGKGQVDMGQLFNKKDLDPESDLSTDQQAVRAGKRGWYDPETGQVRMFTRSQVRRLGTFTGGAERMLGGRDIEKFVESDTPDLTATSGPRPLPVQPKLPTEGTFLAIKTDDGGIYFHPDFEYMARTGMVTHYELIQKLGIPPERVVGGGYIENGVYEGSPRSEAIRIGREAREALAKSAPGEDYSKSKIFGNPRGSIQTSGQDVADTVNRLRFLLFDKFHPVHDLMKKLEKAGIDVPLMKNPSHAVRLLGGLTGRADAKVFYKRFTVDADGNVQFSGKSLNDIYKPHKGDMAGLDDWLWARAEREEHRLNRRRGADEQVKLELSEPEAERIYQAGKARYDQAGKELTEYFHSLLDELADSGLMTKADVASMKALRPEYAPLRKDLDDMVTRLDAASGTNSARKTLDRVKNPLRKRTGTEKDYERIPPTQAAVMMTYEITSAVERNLAARAIVDLRKLSPEMAKLITPTRPKITYVRDISTGLDVPTIGRQESDTVSVSIDGTRHFFKVPEDVAQSMKLIYETGLSRWTKLMAIPARTLRTGATAAPEFAFRNPLRDWLTAFMNAKHGFNPLTDFSRGLFQLVFRGKGPDAVYKKAKMDPEAYWKWKAAGGEWSMLVSLDKSLGEQAVKQMHRETDTGLKAMRKYIKSPIGYLETLSEAGEKPTRLGVFERSRRGGMSDIESALQSRMASTDFAVRGAETKALSALYTFLNARAQTTIQLGKTAVKDPVRFAIKGLAAAGIPSLVLYALNREDPEYWKRDQMERDLFWFLPIDIGGRQVKIPKGEIGLIFGTAVEKVLTYLDHEGVLPEGGGGRPPLNPKVTEFLEDVFRNMSPIGNWGEALPTFARPVAEWVNNKSYYYRTPLESEADKGVAPYLRYKPGTSEIMKGLGKAMGAFNKGEGVSPIMMENTLRGYTGGVGRHALRAADVAADKLGITDRGSRPADPMNTPGAAGFVSRRASGFESEPAKAFYEMAEKIDMTKRTLDELLADKTRAKEVLIWIERHPKEMALLKVARSKSPETGQVTDMFNDAKRELASLRKQANLIAENKSLTSKQKRQALDFLDKKVSAVVDPMWALINAASQTPSKN